MNPQVPQKHDISYQMSKNFSMKALCQEVGVKTQGSSNMPPIVMVWWTSVSSILM
jgi:hypothetical protein